MFKTAENSRQLYYICSTKLNTIKTKYYVEDDFVYLR